MPATAATFVKLAARLRRQNSSRQPAVFFRIVLPHGRYSDAIYPKVFVNLFAEKYSNACSSRKSRKSMQMHLFKKYGRECEKELWMSEAAAV